MKLKNIVNEFVHANQPLNWNLQLISLLDHLIFELLSVEPSLKNLPLDSAVSKHGFKNSQTIGGSSYTKDSVIPSNQKQIETILNKLLMHFSPSLQTKIIFYWNPLLE